MPDHTDGVQPVYHDPEPPGDAPAPIQDRPRAFYIDVYTDDDTDATEHAFYGATNPAGGAVAHTCTGGGVHRIDDPERLADRVGGHVVWT